MGVYEELYHSGVRKNHKYIKKIGDRYFYTQEEIQKYLKGKKPPTDVTFEKTKRDGVTDYRIDFNKHDGGHKGGGWSDGIGVRVGDKRIEYYNTTNQKYIKNPNVKNDTKGRITSEYAEDGVRRTLDYSNSKTYEKRKLKKVQQDKSSIEWLKSMDVDTTENEKELKRDEAEYKRVKRKNDRRKKAKKALANHAKKGVKSLKKQSARGRKAVSKFYKRNINPGVTVTHDEAKLK